MNNMKEIIIHKNLIRTSGAYRHKTVKLPMAHDRAPNRRIVVNKSCWGRVSGARKAQHANIMDHIEAFRPNQSTRIADKNKPGISGDEKPW
jgi:hypothetical protein